MIASLDPIDYDSLMSESQHILLITGSGHFDTEENLQQTIRNLNEVLTQNFPEVENLTIYSELTGYVTVVPLPAPSPDQLGEPNTTQDPNASDLQHDDAVQENEQTEAERQALQERLDKNNPGVEDFTATEAEAEKTRRLVEEAAEQSLAEAERVAKLREGAKVAELQEREDDL